MNIEKIKIPSSKGILVAVIHPLKKPTNKLAILCPGYLDSKDYDHLKYLAEDLNKKDYTVVRFEPTGTWESDGDISDYTMTQYLEDTKNVLEYMLSKSNYDNILLGGHSRGGQLSILYSARDSRVSTVIGIMPSSGTVRGQRREDWEKAGISISQRDLPGENNKKKKEFRVPFSNVLDGDKYNAIDDIKKIIVPVILVAGKLDEIIAPDSIKKLFENANESKKFILIPKVGHDYRHNKDEIEMVNEKIVEQLDSLEVSKKN